MDIRELRALYPNISEDTLALNATSAENAAPERKKRRKAQKRSMREASALAADLELPVLEETNGRLVLRLHGERPLSWNDYTTSINLRERIREYKRVKELVQMTLFGEGYSRRPFEKRVGIECRAYMLSPAYDPDNPAFKPYVDALQRFVIVKDDLRYVRMVVPFVQVVKTAPRVELHIGHDLEWLQYFPDN